MSNFILIMAIFLPEQIITTANLIQFLLYIMKPPGLILKILDLSLIFSCPDLYLFSLVGYLFSPGVSFGIGEELTLRLLLLGFINQFNQFALSVIVKKLHFACLLQASQVRTELVRQCSNSIFLYHVVVWSVELFYFGYFYLGLFQTDILPFVHLQCSFQIPIHDSQDFKLIIEELWI